MKKYYPIFFLCYFIIGCGNQELSQKETVRNYYNAFDSGDYDQIRAAINDSVTILSGDFVTTYDHDSFYTFFKWDSIFKPSYEIVELVEKHKDILVTVSQKNERNAFLKNNPLVFTVKVSFTSGKISKLEELEYSDVNWEVWNKEKNTLVSWIKNNHPDLDGFVEDMTMQGSDNYLKAIELYTSNKGLK